MKKRIISLCLVIAMLTALVPQITFPANAVQTGNLQGATELRAYTAFPQSMLGAGQESIILLAMFTDGKQVSLESYSFQILDPDCLEAINAVQDRKLQIVTVKGVNPGSTELIFTERTTGASITVPITVTDNCQYYRCSDFPGAYVSRGSIYVDSFECTVNQNGSHDISFNAYNRSYSYGAVEVYNEKDYLIRMIPLDPRSDGSGLEFIVNGFWASVEPFVSDAPFYAMERNSKGTSVTLTGIPENARIVISSDGNETPFIALHTGVDIFIKTVCTVSSLDLKVETQEKIGQELLSAIADSVTESISQKEKVLRQSLLNETADTISTTLSFGFSKQSAYSIYEAMYNLFESLHINVDDILKDVLKDLGYSVADAIFMTIVPIYQFADAIIQIIGLAWPSVDYDFDLGRGKMEIHVNKHGLRNFEVVNNATVDEPTQTLPITAPISFENIHMQTGRRCQLTLNPDGRFTCQYNGWSSPFAYTIEYAGSFTDIAKKSDYVYSFKLKDINIISSQNVPDYLTLSEAGISFGNTFELYMPGFETRGTAVQAAKQTYQSGQSFGAAIDQLGQKIDVGGSLAVSEYILLDSDKSSVFLAADDSSINPYPYENRDNSLYLPKVARARKMTQQWELIANQTAENQIETINGLTRGQLIDWDNDGIDELFLLYGEQTSWYLTQRIGLYDNSDGNVIVIGEDLDTEITHGAAGLSGDAGITYYQGRPAAFSYAHHWYTVEQSGKEYVTMWCKFNLWDASTGLLIHKCNISCDGNRLQYELDGRNVAEPEFLALIEDCTTLKYSPEAPAISFTSDTTTVSIDELISQMEYASPQNDWEYSMLEDGTLEITGYNGYKTSIVVPTTIDGVTVSAIGNEVFWGREDITKIELPESITSIGEYAFYYCSNLRDISIPDRVSSIGRCAFEGCKKITTITIPKSKRQN